jgi:hypothetical protein
MSENVNLAMLPLWLTPELWRLRVSEDTLNYQYNCGPSYFQLKRRLAIRHQRFVIWHFGPQTLQFMPITQPTFAHNPLRQSVPTTVDG